MTSLIARRLFIMIGVVLLIALPLYAEEEDDDLFKAVLVFILSDHYSMQLKVEAIEFTEIVESSNIWSSVLKIKEIGDITVIVENLNLCVVLVDERGPALLYRSTKSPPPWSGRALYKSWIYDYLLVRSSR